MFYLFFTFSYNTTILSNSARRAAGLFRFKWKHLIIAIQIKHLVNVNKIIFVLHLPHSWLLCRGLGVKMRSKEYSWMPWNTSLEYINLPQMILFWVSQAG